MKKLVFFLIIFTVVFVLASDFLPEYSLTKFNLKEISLSDINLYDFRLPEINIREKIKYLSEYGYSKRITDIKLSSEEIPFEFNYTEREFSVRGIEIGDSIDSVIEKLGQPQRKDLSKYGFQWYIYNNDYNRYIQVGIDEDRVVGLYTNSKEWNSNKGITYGSSREEVNEVYGKSLKAIKKGNVSYALNFAKDEIDIFLIEDYYVTIFYDIHKDSTITSIQLIERDTELSVGYYGEPSEELRESFERQIFDLANSVRVREGFSPLTWDEKISQTSRKHSEDMAKNSYFNHTSLSNKSPFDRMKDDGIKFIAASENIAAGQTSAIFAHEGWMNSIGHRKNILSKIQRLGVGVYFGGPYEVYYTQKFYTPR